MIKEQLFIFAFFLISSPAFAASQTLTTYYPAPTGAYNKMQSNYLQLTPTTMSDVQNEYQCSFDPSSGLSPCPAGLSFYNMDAHTIFFSDGTHWRYVVASCVPLVACSASLNCSTDNCGNSCGNCLAGKICSSTIPGTPGSCQ